MSTLAENEADIYNSGAVNRNHLLAFLRLQTTSDQLTLEAAVKDWLVKLHNDPHYTKVSFAQGEIDRVLSDLDSYGHVLADTIHEGAAPEFTPTQSTPTQPTSPSPQDITLGTPQVGKVSIFTPSGETTKAEQISVDDPLLAEYITDTAPANEQLWNPLN